MVQDKFMVVKKVERLRDLHWESYSVHMVELR